MQDFESLYNNYFNVTKEGEIMQPPKENQSRPRITSNGRIDTIDKLCNVLRAILNMAWGSDWGVISPATSKGDDPANVDITQINYSINLRESSKNLGAKYKLMDTVKEIVDGEPTGESIRVYRQFFDYIVEFDFINKTSSESENLMSNFEDIMITYSGYLKNFGVSDIMFLKEVPAQYSFNYNKKLPMKCLYYYIKLEKIKTTNVNQIKAIEKIIIKELDI